MSTVHKHHRKRRSQGGDDSYGNLIELPPEVHELVHREPKKAYEYGLLVHSFADPAAIRPDVAGFCADLGVELAQPKKRRNYEKDSQERRQRKRISVAVPADTEDGGAIWDETLAEVKQALFGLGLINPEEYPDPQKYPAYEAIIAALRDWLNDLVPVSPLPDADRDGYA